MENILLIKFQKGKKKKKSLQYWSLHTIQKVCKSYYKRTIALVKNFKFNYYYYYYYFHSNTLSPSLQSLLLFAINSWLWKVMTTWWMKKKNKRDKELKKKRILY